LQDFVFHNPTKIIFGDEAELKIISDIKEGGYKRVMLVYGKGSIKENGLYDKVVRRLIKNELNFTDFGGVRPNPVLSHLRDGIEWARKNSADCILAIGGGSVIDEAKAIAAGVKYEGDVWDFFEMTATPNSALPIFTILTLAATGSEMNSGAVITNEDGQKKYVFSSPYIYPKASALNPAITFSVSPRQSATAAADAISHVLEGYFTKKSEFRLNDRVGEAIIKTIMKDIEKILKNPADYDARASFMWSATLALNGILNVGLNEFGFPNHLLERPISAIYDIPHGEGLAIVMPAWLAWFRQKEPKKVDRFCKKMFKKGGDEGIAAFETWLKTIGLPTRLEDVGIPAADIGKIADNIVLTAKGSKLYKEYDKKTVEEILKKALR
jgi:NADP-dependent alcohol dehydrogenase